MECIVHFEVKYNNGQKKELRGLIMVGKDQNPSREDFLLMFADMGYKLRLTDEEQLLFEASEPTANYRTIRIRRLDTGKDSYVEDRELKSILTNLIPPPSRPM